MTTALRINGRAFDCAAAPEAALVFVLRNDAGCQRVRLGCGQGQCGACGVLIDGRWALSCDTPLWSAAGQDIRTPEGLDGDPVADALRDAFIARQAAQCGYCVSGILVRATALLREQPQCSRRDIAQALARNLCRCGAQQRILDAIEHARDRVVGTPA